MMYAEKKMCRTETLPRHRRAELGIDIPQDYLGYFLIQCLKTGPDTVKEISHCLVSSLKADHYCVTTKPCNSLRFKSKTT